MSIPEQAGKVANNAIDAMRANPSCLAALIVVALFAILNYFEDIRQNERMEQRVIEVSKLLNSCFLDNQQTRSIIERKLGDGKEDRP